MNYQLSPSELTYLYDGCKRCFVLKVKHGIPQPTIPLPAIFSSIAYLQKEYYSGKRTEQISAKIPLGTVRFGEKWVQSGPITFEGTASTCYIKGRFDVVAELDDSSYAVMDFKTGDPGEEKAGLYSRQLHAYAHALENPAEGALCLRPISSLGLLFFVPDHCEQTGPERQIIGGSMLWRPIELNRQAFLDFLREIVCLLDGPLPKVNVDECDWCKYHAKARACTDGSPAGATPGKPDLEIPNCPKCGGPMRLRTGKYGEFWSCLRYPQCNGTRNF